MNSLLKKHWIVICIGIIDIVPCLFHGYYFNCNCNEDI